jgi:hypothetical protein
MHFNSFERKSIDCMGRPKIGNQSSTTPQQQDPEATTNHTTTAPQRLQLQLFDICSISIISVHLNGSELHGAENRQSIIHHRNNRIHKRQTQPLLLLQMQLQLPLFMARKCVAPVQCISEQTEEHIRCIRRPKIGNQSSTTATTAPSRQPATTNPELVLSLAPHLDAVFVCASACGKRAIRSSRFFAATVASG